MRTPKAEVVMVGITVALLAFFAGFYLRGRTGRDIRVEVQRDLPPVSAQVSSSDPSNAPRSPVEADGRLDLNAATQEELESLPGIGPVLARRILQYREDHGGFTAVSELLEVEGVGEKIYQKIANEVKVG